MESHGALTSGILHDKIAPPRHIVGGGGLENGARGDLMDLLLERARGDVGVVKRALEEAASFDPSDDEIAFEKIVEQIDKLMFSELVPEEA